MCIYITSGDAHATGMCLEKRLFENNLITSTTTKKLTSLYIFLLNGNSVIEDIYLHSDPHMHLLALIQIAYWPSIYFLIGWDQDYKS